MAASAELRIHAHMGDLSIRLLPNAGAAGLPELRRPRRVGLARLSPAVELALRVEEREGGAPAGERLFDLAGALEVGGRLTHGRGTAQVPSWVARACAYVAREVLEAKAQPAL